MTLKEELSYVSDYLEVQKFMMEDRLEVFFDVEPQAEEYQVPSLLLQPLVENAVIHGVENLSEGAVIFVSSDLIAGPKGEAAVVIQIADNLSLIHIFRSCRYGLLCRAWCRSPLFHRHQSNTSRFHP